jgi:hypothetical protein
MLRNLTPAVGVAGAFAIVSSNKESTKGLQFAMSRASIGYVH